MKTYLFMDNRINKRKLLLIALLVLLPFSILIYFMYRSILDISIPYPETPAVPEETYVPQDTVYFGVISRFPSNILYQGYQPLMDYLSQETEYHYELIISRTYEQTVKDISEGKLHAAFLGSYIYVASRDHYNIQPILKPLNAEGEPFFHSVLITRKESEIQSIADLKGRRLAVPSEQSFSGNWLQQAGLGDHNLQVTDLEQLKHFEHHHTVVYELMRDNFDAGAVKDRVASEFGDRGVKIIAQSDPIPGSPIVVNEDHDPAIISAITQALLKIDPEDPEFAEMIANWDLEFVYGFARAEDSDYDNLQITPYIFSEP